MAVDKHGELYIFELKAWESVAENPLQILRYGQIYGTSTYSELDTWFRNRTDNDGSLAEAHKAKFDVNLSENSYNPKQVFVVMTNGLDYKTREAIRYWRKCGLDIRPWVYRVYEGNSSSELLLEITAFRVDDKPYEDLAEGYFILNTNFSNHKEDHQDMLVNRKAAAYFTPWKHKIERLERGDVVFLYQSGMGIVAVGEAEVKLQKAAYHDNPDHRDEEYFRKLRNFQLVEPPLTAAEIKSISGVNYVFMNTMFGIDAETGKKIRRLIMDRSHVAK